MENKQVEPIKRKYRVKKDKVEKKYRRPKLIKSPWDNYIKANFKRVAETITSKNRNEKFGLVMKKLSEEYKEVQKKNIK
jgi:hypothetical protein